MVNSFSGFWDWLAQCLAWFLPPSFLTDPFLSQVTLCLQYLLGVWMLYLLIMKPILMLMRTMSYYIYR